MFLHVCVCSWEWIFGSSHARPPQPCTSPPVIHAPLSHACPSHYTVGKGWQAGSMRPTGMLSYFVFVFNADSANLFKHTSLHVGQNKHIPASAKH